MKAVILAAGLGTRLGGVAKPLLRVGGIEIILRTMKLLSPYVDEFIIVASVYASDLDDFLKDKGFKYKIIINNSPERGNGYSFLLTKDYVSDKFVLVMGDHIFSKDFVDEAVKKFGLIGDRSPKYIDVEEATKVKVVNNRVYDIGKKLAEYDCIDTGFFVLDPSVFDLPSELLKEEEITLSNVMKAARVPVSYVDGKLWMDVDTKEELKKANYLIVRNSVKSVGDGFVSRFINRRISTRISAAVVNKLTPNQLTVISFVVGMISAFLGFFDLRLAALVYQFSSILDGCDGEVARASLRQSKLGGYVDSILDRFVDFSFLAVVAWLYPSYLILAIFAIFGSVMVSYSTEKYKAEYGKSIYAEIPKMRYLIGKRDERIFIIMLLCIFGLVGVMFAVIAVLTIARVIATMLIVIKNKS